MSQETTPENGRSSVPLDKIVIRHGIDCAKITHVGTGHLHSDDDDTAYDVDGVMYCGRCHEFIGL